MPSIKKRNGAIDFFKFVFSIIIILFHAQTFYNYDGKVIAPCGHLGVEFFFIVSAFLLASKADKYQGNDWLSESKEMLKRRIVPIYPYMFLAVIAAICFYSYKNFDGYAISKYMFLSIPETFGLQMFGYSGAWLSGVSWYLSALFIVSAITYPILLTKKSKYSAWFAPITALFISGYLCMRSERLNSPGEWWGLCFKGLLRAYASMALGYASYEICKAINNSKAAKTKMRKFRLAFIEIGGFLIAIAYAMLHHQPDAYDYIIPFFLTLAVAVCFSNEGLLQKIFVHKIWNSLGEFSLSIYLNHFFIKENLPRLFPGMSHEKMLVVFIGMVFVVAAINHVLGKLLSKKLNTIESQVTLALFVTFMGFVTPYILNKL